MLRLSQNHHLLFALRAASPLSTAAAAATFPARFVSEDYLVATCGLAPAQALRASKYLPHLKSPANADAVRAFLAGVGLARSDVSAAIVMDPRFLCSSVDKTLNPRIALLRVMGLSTPQISRLVAVVPGIFLGRAKISRLAFYLSLLGSFDKVETTLRKNYYLLRRNVENVVEPNTAFLQQCGLTAADIADLYSCTGNLLTNELEHVKKMVARVEELGVRRRSGMFKRALMIVSNLTPERTSAKMDSLERALGCAEAALAVCKSPSILSLSEVTLGRRVEFLRMEVGLEPSYIARRAVILCYSLEKRLMPRHYVIYVLKAKGMVKKDIDLYSVFALTDKKFVERYLNR